MTNLPLDGLPVSAPVDIRWDKHAIPFVTAESLPDLAVGLGVVHAHLRLGQMEMLRRVAQGRISEMIGIFGLEFDIALRTADICRAVPAIIAMLPEASRIWRSPSSRASTTLSPTHRRRLPNAKFWISPANPGICRISLIGTTGEHRHHLDAGVKAAKVA